MALSINTNLNAYTALNALHSNSSTMQSSIQRLSSGLRIVTSADDPAGLIISQKYAAQVGGLGQAISNAKDGINLVQTTEGALNQVSSILQNMRTLALHAANTGGNDSTAAAADQQQIRAGLDQIDRIAQTTQFGSKVVLNGSAGTTASTSSQYSTFVSGSADTVSGTYSMSVTAAAAKGQMVSAALNTAKLTGTGAADAVNKTNATDTITFKDSSGNLLKDASGNDIAALSIASGSGLTDIMNAINTNAGLQFNGISASLSGGVLTVGNSHVSGTTDLNMTLSANSTTTTGFDTLANIMKIASGATATTAAATGATLMNAETMTFSNSANSVNVNIVNGTSVAAAVTQVNQALKNANINSTINFNETTHKFELANTEYGSSTTATSAFSSSKIGTTSSQLAVAAGTVYKVADGLGQAGGTAGADVAGSFSQTTAGVTKTYAASGSGQFLTGATGTAVDGLKMLVTSASANGSTLTVQNNSLQFQIGAFASQTVNVNIASVSTTQLGTDAVGTTQMSTVNLDAIDVTTNKGAGAADAVRVIDAAINAVSTLRSSLGAFQTDVLQSSVSNLTTAQQNIRASQSQIQDADFATEMLGYSRGQILGQTSMSMLTQANQASQQVLKLFQ